MCDCTQTNNLQALFIIASVCLMSSQFTSSLNLRINSKGSSSSKMKFRALLFGARTVLLHLCKHSYLVRKKELQWTLIFSLKYIVLKFLLKKSNH